MSHYDLNFLFFRLSSKEKEEESISLSLLKSPVWQATGFLKQFIAVPFWKAFSSPEAKLPS